jgi:hypothetical protein
MRAVACFVALLLVISSARSFAQQPAGLQAYINQMVFATENSIRRLKGEFSKHLRGTEKQIFDQIDFRVDPFDWNIYGTRAYKDTGRHAVFTIGFLMASDYMDRAWLELMLLKDDDFEEYMRYVADKIRESVTAVQTGAKPPAIRGYCEYLGNSSSQCESMRGNAQYAKAYPLFKVSGLAVVMGHEIGHHVKGHLDRRPEDARRRETILTQERQADEFGLTLAIKAGINPIYSIGDLVLFGSFTLDHPFAQPADRHPHPMCRVFQALESGVAAMEADSEARAYLKEHGNADLLSQSRAMLNGAKANMPRECFQ